MTTAEKLEAHLRRKFLPEIICDVHSMHTPITRIKSKHTRAKKNRGKK